MNREDSHIAIQSAEQWTSRMSTPDSLMYDWQTGRGQMYKLADTLRI